VTPAGISRIDGSIRIAASLVRDHIEDASRGFENDAGFWEAVQMFGVHCGGGGKRNGWGNKPRSRRTLLSEMKACGRGTAERAFATQSERLAA
jgi:hypothetical protein